MTESGTPSASATSAELAPALQLSQADIELDAEGRYEVVLAPRDPGHRNWIDTAGLTEGIFAIRYLLLEERELPDVEVISLG